MQTDSSGMCEASALAPMGERDGDRASRSIIDHISIIEDLGRRDVGRPPDRRQEDTVIRSRFVDACSISSPLGGG
jgi:hypothetical protein